jgi:hypothetical protein
MDDTAGLPVPDDCPHCCDEEERYDDDDDDYDSDPDEYGYCPVCNRPTPVCECSYVIGKSVSTETAATDNNDQLPAGDFAHVYNPDRAEELRSIGIDPERVPIVSIIPTLATLPIKGRQLIYNIDIRRLTDDQLRAMAGHLAKKHGIPVEEVARLLPQVGCPLLVDDTVAMSTSIGKYL